MSAAAKAPAEEGVWSESKLIGAPPVDENWHRVPTERMGQPILTVDDARRAAKQPAQYLLWVQEKQACRFDEPGWIKLEPPRDGGVLFAHREREVRAVRQRGIL